MSAAFPLNQVQMDLTDNRRAAWDKGEFVGKDGLDQTLGRAALYVKGHPAWHSLGFWDEFGEVQDVDTFLDRAGLNWTTELVPVEYAWEGEHRFDISPETSKQTHFVSVRSDVGTPLGVVGKVYTEVQNRAAYEFLDELLATGQVIPDSGGVLRGGRSVFLSVRLPENVVLDPGGLADEIIPFINLKNSHDGQTPFRIDVSPWRIECRNTERFDARDAAFTWKGRHTTNVLERLEEARRTLGLTVTYLDAWKLEEETLLHAKATAKDVDRLLAQIWKREDEETVRVANKAEARIEAVKGIFNQEVKTVGRNLYAVERSLTGYLDNFADVRPRGSLKGDIERGRALALMEGANDKAKNTAHKVLMERATNR